MTGAIIRRWEATMARVDIGRWLDTFKARAFAHMRAVRRSAGAAPARRVMPDFMAPFFTDYDAEASFHDELLVEAKQ